VLLVGIENFVMQKTSGEQPADAEADATGSLSDAGRNSA
jgi:hypothetical protein